MPRVVLSYASVVFFFRQLGQCVTCLMFMCGVGLVVQACSAPESWPRFLTGRAADGSLRSWSSLYAGHPARSLLQGGVIAQGAVGWNES